MFKIMIVCGSLMAYLRHGTVLVSIVEGLPPNKLAEKEMVASLWTRPGRYSRNSLVYV